MDSLIRTQVLDQIPQHEHKYSAGYAQQLQDWHQESLDTIQKMEEAEREAETAQKLARLHELRLEVEGLDYVKELIEKEVKQKQQEEEGKEQDVQTAT